MSDTCVCCGIDIPEGRQVCPNCENAHGIQPDAILKDGTHPMNTTLQLFLYDLLNRRNK